MASPVDLTDWNTPPTGLQGRIGRTGLPGNKENRMHRETATYRSPYEAYPFLSDAPDDLRCDFELATDRMASEIGLLRAGVRDDALRAELLRMCELVYHMNPTLRTRFTVTAEEIGWVRERVEALRLETASRCERFVLTQGSESGCRAHVLRVAGKELVRLLYRHMAGGRTVPEALVDLANLLSGYFFHLALKLNEIDGVDEVPYTSRNYASGL